MNFFIYIFLISILPFSIIYYFRENNDEQNSYANFVDTNIFIRFLMKFLFFSLN